MFVPIYDDNPLRHIRFQFVTLALVAVNCGLFLVEKTGVPHEVLASFAIIPVELMQVGVFGGHAVGSHDAIPVAERLTLLTYMFLHGDVFHLAGNMLFLWVFGDNVEDALGHWRFLLFYLACGVLAGLAHALMQQGSGVPLIGASGAVSGVIAAYLMLHPRIRVWVLALKVIPLRISAGLAIGVWILTQVVMLVAQMAGQQIGPVAWWAHIFGLIAGAILVVLLRRPGVPLFDNSK